MAPGSIAGCYVNPNARCPVCKEPVFFYANEFGSRVYFDDPFEPILPILEAESPVGEYRRITEEVLRYMPDERLYPRPVAEAARSFLMLRIGLHTGLRQKNLSRDSRVPIRTNADLGAEPRGHEMRRVALECSRRGLGDPDPLGGLQKRQLVLLWSEAVSCSTTLWSSW